MLPCVVLLVMCVISLVDGHGMLMDPVSRNSAWRKGFPTPADYTDNQLSCGGLGIQWGKNKGKCGACGDPYHIQNQRYVHPGKGATGTIVKTYRQGQVITATIRITANHMGWNEFRISDIGSPPITQEKLNQHLLQLADGTGTRWPLPKGTGMFSVDLKLPNGLVCNHCVLQWWWKCGNNWGCDDTGCGVGKAFEQETFVNCADVTILPKDGTTPEPTLPPSPPQTLPPTQPTDPPTTKPPTTQAPVTTSPPTQPPDTIPPSTQSPTQPPHTHAPVTNPPPTDAPGGKCRADGAWRGNSAMDQWCELNCARNHCPTSHCICN